MVWNAIKQGRWGRAAGLALAVLLPVGGAQAQGDGWKPEGKVEFVIPGGAGAALDMAGRKLTQLLAEQGASPRFVVSNKVSAHAITALEQLQRESGNPNVLMTLSTGYVNSQAQGALPDRLTHNTVLGILFKEYVAVVVRADSPVKTGQDLIAALRKDPAALSIGVANTLGGHVHLGVAKPLQQGKVDIAQLRVVPYKSSAESMVALVGGHLDVAAVTTPNLLPYLDGGRVRVLAVAAEERLEGAFAQVPTWREQGVDAVSVSFQGVMAPPGIGEAQRQYWAQALRRVSDSPQWREFVALNQWKSHYIGPGEAQRFVQQEIRETHRQLLALGLPAGPLPAQQLARR
ncbi:MAG: tripartite tricarboxylate transporter substrate binding protein [Comamonas sp.]